MDKFRIWSSLLLVSVCAYSVIAQQSLRLPPFKKLKLPNGMTVVLVEQHETPIVDFHVLVRAGGTINSYLGDAVFAYWRQDKHPAGKVGAALRELVRAQTASLRPFRILVHFGRTRISGGLQGESLSGPEVIYLFRIEKATKGLGSDCILSEPAAKSLSLLETAQPLGECAVPDYTGSHRFYGLSA